MRKKISCTTSNSKIVHVPKYSASNTASSGHFWKSVQTEQECSDTSPAQGPISSGWQQQDCLGHQHLSNSSRHMSSCVLTLYVAQPLSCGKRFYSLTASCEKNTPKTNSFVCFEFMTYYKQLMSSFSIFYWNSDM